MRKLNRLVLILPLLALAGCVTQSIPFAKEFVDRGFEAKRAYLVGKWYGDAPLAGGGRRIWLNHRYADGTFTITFVAVREGEPPEIASEYGDWGLSGDIYFTMNRGEGAKIPKIFQRTERYSYVDDAYRITSLTAQEFHYTSVATGRSFATHKVADDFELPEAFRDHADER